jgi:hypothetical protein
MRFKPSGVRQINDPGSAIGETAPRRRDRKGRFMTGGVSRPMKGLIAA